MDHIKKLCAATEASEVDALLLLSEANRRYATLFPSSDGAVIVTAKKLYFLTDSRYIEAAKTALPNAEVMLVSGDRWYSKVINEIISGENIKLLGFEEDSLTYSEYVSFSETLSAELVPAQHIVSDLRASKDEDELIMMRKAQEIAEGAFNELVPLISLDMTEKELAAELVYRMVRHGAEKESFDTIAISGTKTSMPHGVPEMRKLRKGFLTIDFGAVYNGYCSDTTRTLCIGKPTDKMRLVYDTVLEAQLAGIEKARAGVTGSEIDGAAREVIKKAGFGECFGHAFGHSLGIEIHESPNASPKSTFPMPAGAVISAEPGIYIPGEFGVRIEDVLVLNEKGSEDITNLTKELIIL